jgi:hypothetical protein
VGGLFVLAAWHKVVVVRHGEAAEERLISVRNWHRREATAVLVLLAVVEAATACAIFLLPEAGWATAALLISFYLTQLRHLGEDEGCNCFGRVAATSRRVSIQRRNRVLVLVSAILAVAFAAGAVGRVEAGSEASIAAAILVASLLAGNAAVQKTQLIQIGRPSRLTEKT